jgi:hypothetical protein
MGWALSADGAERAWPERAVTRAMLATSADMGPDGSGSPDRTQPFGA